MFLRPNHRDKDGKDHTYWSLVETVRTPDGPLFLLYAMRRVDCHRCEAVIVEEVPWGDGKRQLTKAYMLFLARWARRLSWKADTRHTDLPLDAPCLDL